MTQSGDLLALRDERSAQPSFEVALRGYKQQQVDRYVTETDSEIAALTADREKAYRQLQAMAAQLQQLQADVADLRQRPARVDRTHHLPPRPRPSG